MGFKSYLRQPLSNCSTLIFDMMAQIEPIPIDYRALLAGLLPEYLLDEKAIDTRYTADEWRAMAHANPHVGHLIKTDMDSDEFSRLIRQGLPTQGER